MSAKFGPLSPLQRDGKTDFAHGTGPVLAMSRIMQVFSTRGSSAAGPGELPWNTDFGCALHTLRHARRDNATAALARAYVAEAFTRWLPDLAVTAVDVTYPPRGIQLSVSFRDPAGPHHLDFYIGGPPDSFR